MDISEIKHLYNWNFLYLIFIFEVYYENRQNREFLCIRKTEKENENNLKVPILLQILDIEMKIG